MRSSLSMNSLLLVVIIILYKQLPLILTKLLNHNLHLKNASLDYLRFSLSSAGDNIRLYIYILLDRMSKREPPKNLIPESAFQETAADCLLQFEKYRLKTHLVGINLEKGVLPSCYDILETRMIERYEILYQRLREGVQSLYKNFTIAQASTLRTLNNVMRNYRRRVGTLGNQPLSNFKYNRFDKSEKVLLQALIYNDKDSYEEILKFQQEINTALDQGNKEIEDNYKQNQKIREDYSKILQIIEKTECFAFKYYDNFERSMVTTISSMESYFDKLNGYLTVWENVASTKAYEAKSSKEIDMDERNAEYDHSRRFGQEETEEQLEELLKNCPQNSFQREQYRRRLNELRHYNNEKEKKLESVGRMLNKRKNRTGILVNKRRDINLLDWYIDIDNNRTNFSFQDQFKNLSVEGDSGEFRPTEYEIQKPFKKEKIEEIKQHLQKYQSSSSLNYEWWYDKFGKEGTFDLILCSGQQIQKRVEFEMTRQYELQCTDDRRKRDFFEKQTNHMRDGERRESLHIGYLNPQQKTEMDLLQEKPYGTDYWPQTGEVLKEEQNQDSSFEFSDDSQSEEEKELRQLRKQQIQKLNQLKKIEMFESLVGVALEKEQKGDVVQEKVRAEEAEVKLDRVVEGEVRQQQKHPENPKEEYSVDIMDACLEQKIIRTYFKEYSNKVLRKEDEPFYKKSKFLYYDDLEAVPWSTLDNYFECEKIFIYLKSVIIYFRRVFSVQQEKIKCKVYTLKEDLDEETLRNTLKQCFESVSMTVVKFVPIYPNLEEDQIPSFMIGLLLTLVKCGDMPEDYDDKRYLQEGRVIIEDFNYYFEPENCQSKTAIMKKFKPMKAKNYFNPKKVEAEAKVDIPPQKSTEKTSTAETKIMTTPSVVQKLEKKTEIQDPLLHKTVQAESRPIKDARVRFVQEEATVMPSDNFKEEDSKIKRNDSKERLNGFPVQIVLSENVGDGQNENDNDFESL